MPRLPIKRITLSIIILLIVVAGIMYLMHSFAVYPSTEDAYVVANKINIAAEVTGPVKTIAVVNHQMVQADELLFTIDSTPFKIAVDKAKADVAQKQSAFNFAEQNAKRFLHLVKIGQETRSIGDQYQSQLESAKSALSMAQAQLEQAELNLKRTFVRAPRSGIVTQFELRPGNHVIANNILFVIIEQKQFWVDANFKETQLERIRPNQTAKIMLDMYPDHQFKGVVQAISIASGSIFSLLPPENASGNWVKVTQRFPVKIMIDHTDTKYPLRAGATATVTVDTTSHYP